MNLETIEYIIQFLLSDLSKEGYHKIGYTSNPKEYDQYDLVFIPSGFFNDSIYGTPASMPQFPLQEIEGIPFLFGENKKERKGNTLLIHADLIASTYFLISRYEEYIKTKDRDTNGRFPGKHSIPFKGGFIHRPIVDEYRLLIRRWLVERYPNLSEIQPGIKKIYLTHDVDAPFLYRTWKGFIRSLLNRRSLAVSWKNKFGPIQSDPFYTFPWLLEKDQQLIQSAGKDKAEIIFFVKGGGKVRQDKPIYDLSGKDIQQLLQLFQLNHASIGLHTSYYAGIYPQRITVEKEALEKAIASPIYYNRHHFLTSREPNDMEYLSNNHITDDFTMGYADMAGFRLGTSYPVRWINPSTQQLSDLILHPLCIMDCTLDNPAYMGLNADKANEYCTKIIQQIHKVGGEVVLLWHNTSFALNTKNYHRELYTYLLKILS